MEVVFFFFFKQKTAYEIYQCDWSSDVCSSDLVVVSRYLQKLKKEDIVIARRGSLEIKDLHALVEKIEHHVSLNTKHST